MSCLSLYKETLEPVPGAAGGSGPGSQSLDETKESRMSIPEFDITGRPMRGWILVAGEAKLVVR